MGTSVKSPNTRCNHGNCTSSACSAPAEVAAKLDERLREIDLTSSLTVLAAVEAAFHIDYLQRCYGQGEEAISLAFRDLYKTKQKRASLVREIFDA